MKAIADFFYYFTSVWWGILIITLLAVFVWLLLSLLLYRVFFKRFYDLLLSFVGLIILSPVLLILTIVGAVKMKGNPFFVQKRPGKGGKIFNLIKFRTMTNKRYSDGNLLQDKDRLTKYGKFLRSTSLDELPELFNIFLGQMSIVGPRPLLVRYLNLYSEEQKRRHCVRPGLTGLAQVSGRNAISWEQKFEKDLEYIDKISLLLDLKILIRTVGKILIKEGIAQEGNATMEYFLGNPDKTSSADINNVCILSCGRRVELVKAFKCALKNSNNCGIVIGVDISKYAPALYFADKYCCLPPINDGQYIEKLIDLCNDEKITLIVPTIDTELLVLSENKKLIESKTNARVLVSDYESVELCRNKIKSAEFFEKNKFDVPKTFSDEELKNKEYKFPLFIKPKNGSSSINSFKINNEKELLFFKDYVPEPIVQECVSGIEYTVDVLLDFEGNPITIVPRKRLATRGGEILKGQIDKNPIIITEVNRLLENLHFIGHITIQGFFDGSNFKYIEINPRFGGGAPMSFLAGADSPLNIIKLLNGEKLIYNENYRDKIIFSRFDDCIEIKDESDDIGR